MPFVLILIIVSSLLTPLFLKISYRKELPDSVLNQPLTPALADGSNGAQSSVENTQEITSDSSAQSSDDSTLTNDEK